MKERESVPFTLKGPFPVSCCEGPEKLKRVGCAMLDLHFPQPSNIAELVFTNYYSAFISVFVKRVSAPKTTSENCENSSKKKKEESSVEDESVASRCTANLVPGSEISNSTSTRSTKGLTSTKSKGVALDQDISWEFCLSKVLMPLSHFELGSQETFSVLVSESVVEWKGVVIMRLAIHQPSASLLWKQFSVGDITLWKSLPSENYNLLDIPRKDGRLAALKENTKRIFSGMTVEPIPESPSEEKQALANNQ